MAEIPEAQQRRRKLLGLTSDKLNTQYAHWAAQYDEDLVDALGYSGPSRAADVIADEVPVDSRILDIGTGTGLVGAGVETSDQE